MALLAACDTANRDIARIHFKLGQVSSETDLQSDVPENPIIVFQWQSGFANWPEALNAHEGVSYQIEFSEVDNAVVHRYDIGSKLPTNAGYYATRRKNKSWDFGVRLVMPKLKTPKMKIVISDPHKRIMKPMEIIVQKLNEMP